MIKILGEIVDNQLPVVETNRLLLRQRKLEDAKEIFEFVKLDEVSYPAGFPAVKSLEEEITYIQEIYPTNLEKEKLPSGYAITLKGDDKVIGSVDFNHRHEDDIFEIGYLLHPDYWGQGIVPEAASALVEIGFTLLGLHKIAMTIISKVRRLRAN